MNASVGQTRDWIDVLQALLTPTLAFFGILIAWLQWRTNDQRLKHERFGSRYAVVQALRHFLQSIVVSGDVLEDERLKFLSATAGSRFIFDKTVSEYLSEVHDKAVDLQTARAESAASTKEEKGDLVKQQSEIKHWVIAQLRSVDEKFTEFF